MGSRKAPSIAVIKREGYLSAISRAQSSSFSSRWIFSIHVCTAHTRTTTSLRHALTWEPHATGTNSTPEAEGSHGTHGTGGEALNHATYHRLVLRLGLDAI
jgi:hypothetical protein